MYIHSVYRWRLYVKVCFICAHFINAEIMIELYDKPNHVYTYTYVFKF